METVASDAVVQYQDRGSGISANVDVHDAASQGIMSALSSMSTYKLSGLNIVNDNGTWKVTAGVAYVEDTSSSTATRRTDSGNQTIKENKDVDHGVEVPDGVTPVATVVVPSAVDITVDVNQVNDVYLKFDVGQNNTVTLIHGSGVSEPIMPSIQLGQIDDSQTSVVSGNDYADINARVNSVSQRIESFEETTLPDGQTMFVPNNFTVDGTLNLEGSGEITVIA